MNLASELSRCTTWYLEGAAEEGGSQREIALESFPFRVGRRSDLSLCLAFAGVSKVHAEFVESSNRLAVRDLGSTNGTYVNGKRILDEQTLQAGDRVHFATVEFRIGRHAEPKTERQSKPEAHSTHCIPALLQFDLLMNGGAVPHYQPIIELAANRTIGYEVLARSNLEGLRRPDEMFAFAERIHMESDLSEMFRREGLEQAPLQPRGANIFLNTHPHEVDQPRLIEALRELRRDVPNQPLTLEIHEAAVTRAQSMRELRAALKDHGAGLAYDDFGAGRARLLDLVEVPPDHLKFDICLIRDIHTAGKQRQQMLEALVKMVGDLGIAALAEGVECAGEHETCVQIGFRFAQGYYYGRPAPASHYA